MTGTQWIQVGPGRWADPALADAWIARAAALLDPASLAELGRMPPPGAATAQYQRLRDVYAALGFAYRALSFPLPNDPEDLGFAAGDVGRGARERAIAAMANGMAERAGDGFDASRFDDPRYVDALLRFVNLPGAGGWQDGAAAPGPAMTWSVGSTPTLLALDGTAPEPRTPAPSWAWNETDHGVPARSLLEAPTYLVRRWQERGGALGVLSECVSLTLVSNYEFLRANGVELPDDVHAHIQALAAEPHTLYTQDAGLVNGIAAGAAVAATIASQVGGVGAIVAAVISAFNAAFQFFARNVQLAVGSGEFTDAIGNHYNGTKAFRVLYVPGASADGPPSYTVPDPPGWRRPRHLAVELGAMTTFATRSPQRRMQSVAMDAGGPSTVSSANALRERMQLAPPDGQSNYGPAPANAATPPAPPPPPPPVTSSRTAAVVLVVCVPVALAAVVALAMHAGGGARRRRRRR